MSDREQRCLACVLAVTLLLTAGCQSGRKAETTRIQPEDFDETVHRMAGSLRASEFLAGRGDDAPPIYITINRVENLTTDLIPPAEQWKLMARVQGAMPMRELAEHHNVHFQIPPEQVEQLREAGFDEPIESLPRTTHLMYAVFMSNPRGAAVDQTGPERYTDRRSDYYYFEYSVVDLKSREIKWRDTFEFTREAAGLTID